jgi:hypothetical protein
MISTTGISGRRHRACRDRTAREQTFGRSAGSCIVPVILGDSERALRLFFSSEHTEEDNRRTVAAPDRCLPAINLDSAIEAESTRSRSQLRGAEASTAKSRINGHTAQ